MHPDCVLDVPTDMQQPTDGYEPDELVEVEALEYRLGEALFDAFEYLDPNLNVRPYGERSQRERDLFRFAVMQLLERKAELLLAVTNSRAGNPR